MEIHGLNKTTLLDYPEHVACTVFTGACNFRCPFCHNGELVLHSSSQPKISDEEFFSFLQKRRPMLEGVCITGGEPTLQHDLYDFICRIKEMGLLVKLDTNGSSTETIRSLYEAHLIDYVAMDIKSSPSSYINVAGLHGPADTNQLMQQIMDSVAYLMSCGISYEFRTTVVGGLHTFSDFEEIADWLHGCKAYFLQSFAESDSILSYSLPNSHPAHYAPGTFYAFTPEKLREIAAFLNTKGVPTKVRGV